MDCMGFALLYLLHKMVLWCYIHVCNLYLVFWFVSIKAQSSLPVHSCSSWDNEGWLCRLKTSPHSFWDSFHTLLPLPSLFDKILEEICHIETFLYSSLALKFVLAICSRTYEMEPLYLHYWKFCAERKL